jgi:uncharacterized BrkB/YihY/UPF0761 family membrane protein
LGRLGNLIGRWFLHAQRMFHMLVGLVFLVLAVAGATVAFKLWGDYRRSPAQGLLTFGMVASFTVLLLFCCLYSFAKARSVR